MDTDTKNSHSDASETEVDTSVEGETTNEMLGDIPGAVLVSGGNASDDPDVQEIDDMKADISTISDENNEGEVKSLVAIEGLIKRKLARIEELKDEGKTYREMVESYLDNDNEYSELSLKAKEANKEKNARKKILLEAHEIESTVEKLRENKTQMKEIREGLSADLSQFQKLSGATEIELDEGDLRQIVYVAKLVRRSTQG